MTDSIDHRPIAAEEALELLKLDHDLMVECREAEDVDIGFETSVHDWFWLGEDLASTWVSNAKRLNTLFEIDAPISEWKPVLTPSRKRTVRDICDFVGKRSRIPCIPEPRILGQSCRTAGAFMTLKKLLSDAGADTSDLAPSTPLADYAESGLPRIYLSLIRAAPPLIKRVDLKYRCDAGYIAFAMILFFTLLPLTVAGLNSNVFFLMPALLALSGFLWTWRHSEQRMRHPMRVEFDGLDNFRDLSKALAGEL